MFSSLPPHSLTMIAITCCTGGNYSGPPMASESGQGLTETLTAEMATPPSRNNKRHRK